MKTLIYVLMIFFVLSLAPAAFTGLQAQQTKEAPKKTKKGKYALIGAGVGAGTGVLVSKKKGKGALIGGAAGAGAGYLYGRHKQK
jgi:glucokinase